MNSLQSFFVYNKVDAQISVILYQHTRSISVGLRDEANSDFFFLLIIEDLLIYTVLGA